MTSRMNDDVTAHLRVAEAVLLLGGRRMRADPHEDLRADVQEKYILVINNKTK